MWLKQSTPQENLSSQMIIANPSTSKGPVYSPSYDIKRPWHKKWKSYVYNNMDKTFCGRSCGSWWRIIAYTIMYFIFQATFTMLLLYFSLMIMRRTIDTSLRLEELQQYSNETVGLSASPVSEHSFPLIWYRKGEREQFQKYIRALDSFIRDHKKENELVYDLGPCGGKPYGYGERPCILIRINKQLGWKATPLKKDSPRTKEAPKEIQEWVKRSEEKYWLHCKGYHPYDQEHLGEILYYPHPPGIDANYFPLNASSPSPVVAIQLQDFAVGISLAIHCSLWYESGTSTIDFMFYISPNRFLFRQTMNLSIHL